MKRVFVALLFAASMQAQAPPSFREGVLAFENKEWATAEQKMREAIAGNPNETEGTVRISGQWFETYVPHYFLARALAKQGKCAEAIKHFEESERQGVTLAISDFARHVKNRGGCGPQPKKEPPKKTVGEVVVPFGEQEAVVTPTPTTTTEPPKTTTTAPPKKVEQPTIAILPPKDRFASLRLAVEAYLRGNYEETARLLSAPSYTDPNAMAETALFRAAAYDALDRISGGTNQGFRDRVEADLRIYRTLRPDGKPDPRVFPPRFIAMVNRR